ncbi:MAG: tetratricopeptide repeat protein [Anaerolineae bacterium]|nr:tetratricopeptide repeat protein [Anaerolineae bacterium]
MMPLLTTKLYIPPIRPKLISRPRLVDWVSAAIHYKLTLISAPAGFGKTTLLGECAARCGRPVAWLSLDESDNDPARFLAYLIAALQNIEMGIGREALRALDAPQAPPVAALLVDLINEIAAMPVPFVLVLDDYHLIEAQPIHDALAFLLDHQPPHMHLVLATRADPPLPLARLRARGQLAELRQSDLCFTTKEAAAFLNDVMGLGLSAEHVAALEARTEGWIAGLQMAALSLQGRSQDPAARSEFVQAFTGSHRFVLDYLVGEVLDQQPAAIQEFLLKTSILKRLAGPLCDAVAVSERAGEPGAGPAAVMPGYSDSQAILERLDAANLFIVPLDDERSWYRYHRLFADLLRRRLWQTYPDLPPTLHRRASEWHEQQGLMAAAIDHALAAQDLDRAARLIEENVEATLMRSEVTTFLNWVGKLPDESVRSRPTLCYFYAWALSMSGRSLDVVEQRLQDAARAQDAASMEPMAGRMAALRAYLMVFRADMRRAVELGRQALEQLPESDLFLRSVVAWILGLARLDDGDLQHGAQALEEVATMSQEIGNPLIAVAALCQQARLQMRQGRLHQARETFERALQLAADPYGQRLPIASKALVGLGELEREWNDLEAAAGYLTESIELAKQWSEMAAFDAYFPLARTRLAQGDVQAAREAIETARQIADRSEATKIDDLVADLQQAGFLVSQGDFEGATRWAETRGLAPGRPSESAPGLDERQDPISAHLRKYEQLVLARLLISQGRAVEALDLLQPLLALARKLGRIDLTIEIQILIGLACGAEGQDVQAIEALAEALRLAEPGGYIRMFVDQGQPVARLLRQAASGGVAPAYVAKLLAAFGPEPAVAISPQVQAIVEPLSERELAVLRLLAAGLSNSEIAAELVVAVSTVRSHCKNIYSKLDVHRRWAAVQRAQELGLI